MCVRGVECEGNLRLKVIKRHSRESAGVSQTCLKQEKVRDGGGVSDFGVVKLLLDTHGLKSDRSSVYRYNISFILNFA